MADVTVDSQIAAHAFRRAVTVAGRAPSIHNSQPWRWRLADGTCELHAERGRQTHVTDPDGLLLTLSCGAALHHARVALAAEGWLYGVRRLPDAGDPDLFAQVWLRGQTTPNAAAVRLSRVIHLRRTDRRPLARTPLDPRAVATLRSAVEAEGGRMHVLRRGQVVELAAAASRAQQTERTLGAWREEMADWAGGTRPGGTGVPSSAIPRRATATTVPTTDFNQVGSLEVSAEHDKAATFAVLYGDEDTPMYWLRAGEGLSAAWLTATDIGVSVVPMSAPIEVVGTREVLRALLAHLGHPYLVLRLGIIDRDLPETEPTPRLPTSEIIETAT